MPNFPPAFHAAPALTLFTVEEDGYHMPYPAATSNVLSLNGMAAALENDAYDIPEVLVTEVPPIARETGSRLVRAKGSASF